MLCIFFFITPKQHVKYIKFTQSRKKENRPTKHSRFKTYFPQILPTIDPASNFNGSGLWAQLGLLAVNDFGPFWLGKDLSFIVFI